MKLTQEHYQALEELDKKLGRKYMAGIVVAKIPHLQLLEIGNIKIDRNTVYYNVKLSRNQSGTNVCLPIKNAKIGQYVKIKKLTPCEFCGFIDL